jgi:CheY-like chemotaxis protein
MKDKEHIRVLIVDDEDRFRETTATILTRRGFDVLTAADGLEAIKQVQDNPLDVVILDVKMPGMSGNEVLRELKSMKPEIMVIMLTGHGTPNSVLESLQDGVFDYLSKPCDIEILSMKIREAFTKETGISKEERRVRDIMVPLSSFSTIREDRSVSEAINVIIKSFSSIMGSDIVHENIHRSILILDKKSDKVIGVLSFTDLLQGLRPEFMEVIGEWAGMTKSIYEDPVGWSGFFSIMARDLAQKPVRDLMSEAPPTIEADANLMQAINRLLGFSVRRLLVMEDNRAVGVIREQDLFFEMANLLRQHPKNSEGTK